MQIPNMQINTAQWLQLPNEVRQELIKVFRIPRSEGTQKVGNTVTSDGYTNRDLAHITMPLMRAFLGDESTIADAELDFIETFNKVLDKIEGPKEEEPVTVAPTIAHPLMVNLGGHLYTVTEVMTAVTAATTAVANDPLYKLTQPPKAPAAPKNKGGRPKGSKSKPK